MSRTSTSYRRAAAFLANGQATFYLSRKAHETVLRDRTLRAQHAHLDPSCIALQCSVGGVEAAVETTGSHQHIPSYGLLDWYVRLDGCRRSMICTNCLKSSGWVEPMERRHDD